MFLVIFLGLFYSEDIDYGFKYLIRITPFIVFPVCFLLLQKNKFIFSEKTLNTGKLLFYLSTLFFFLSIFMFFYGKGYVTENYAKPGTEIAIRIREKDCPAQVVKLPFIKK